MLAFFSRSLGFPAAFWYIRLMGMPKTPKGRMTKQKILDSSIALINKRGFDNLTLNDLCEASGVAIGTFYHYFHSTQEILFEVVAREGEEILDYYRGLRDRSPLRRLRKIIRFQLDYFEKKGKEVVGHIYRMEIANRQGSARLIGILPTMAIVHETIDAAKEAGELRGDLDPGRTAMLLMSLIFGYSFAWLADGETRTLREIAHDHLMAELDRMRAETSRAR